MLASARAFAIPMRTRFRGITVREGALVQGPAGWGEFSPFAEYGPRECARWLACALEAALDGWPAPVRDRVPVNVTVPAVGPEQARAIVAASGARTAKVKVAEPGEPESADLARVEAVRDALGPAGKLRIDANAGWDVPAAARMLAALARFDLEYAEQPCATLDDLAALRRLTSVPLAADESIRRAEDPLRVRAAGAADIVVIKAQPLGGVRAGLEIAAACGLPAVVSSAVESSVGLAAGVALAAALPDLRLRLRPGHPLAADRRCHHPFPGGTRWPPAGRVRPAGAGLADRLGDRPGPVARPDGGRGGGTGPARRARPPRRRQPVNPSTALARVLVDELRRCGLRDIVLAPGSRSAPLAMAAHAASAAGPGGLRLHVRLDERSAAFLALGLSRASGRPTAVLCTSGTAAAHFHAAVIEADEAAVPLLVLTADRPPELRGTGASQVIDQLRLYGPAVRWFCEVGVPEAGPDGAARPGQARYWRSMACQAWARAAGTAGGPPGPVHLNLAFREPLVPADASPDDTSPADASPDWGLGGRPGREPWTRFAGPALDLPWAERGVIVAGDGARDPAALAALAEAAGWPLLAEPSSGARRGPAALSAYPYLLASAGVPGRPPARRDRVGGPPRAVPAAAGPAARPGRPAAGPARGAGQARRAAGLTRPGPRPT